MARPANIPRRPRKTRALAKGKAPKTILARPENNERQLVGQIFCGVLALFGILIAVVSILVGLYADTQRNSVEAYILWGLIVTTTLAVVLSSITAGGASARMTGYDVPLNSIQGMVYVVLFLITTCVLIVVVVGLRYL